MSSSFANKSLLIMIAKGHLDVVAESCRSFLERLALLAGGMMPVGPSQMNPIGGGGLRMGGGGGGGGYGQSKKMLVRVWR